MGEIDAGLDEARQALRSVLDRVRAEIGNYPAPIAGCDAQFNYLLSLRKRLTSALQSLDAPKAP